MSAEEAVISYYYSKACPYCREIMSLYCNTAYSFGFTFDWLVGKLQLLAYRCKSKEMS